MTFTWNSGDILPVLNPATVNSLDTLAIATTSGHFLDGRTLTNHGTVNWSSGNIGGGNNGSIINAVGGVFNDLNSTGHSIYNAYSGSFVFDNSGTYVRNAAGISTVAIPFNNSGTVSVQQGTLALTGGGTSSGSFAVSSGATLNFGGGTSTLNSGAALSGAGTFGLSTGTLSLSSAVTLSNLTLNGGTLAGAGSASIGNLTHSTGSISVQSLTLTGTGSTWTGGNWNGAAGSTASIAAGAVLGISFVDHHYFDRRVITNLGTVNWSGGYLRSGNSGGFINQNIWNDTNASSANFDNYYGGTAATFNNSSSGTYTKTGAGTVTFQVPFNNSGRVILEHGELRLDSTTAFQSTGTLSFVLSGSTSRTDYGLLAVSNALILDGVLQLSFSDGFESRILSTDTFTLATATGISGAFSNIANGGRLLTLGGYGTFQVNYGAGSAFATNSLILSHFAPVPEPATWILTLLGAVAMMVGRRKRIRDGKC